VTRPEASAAAAPERNAKADDEQERQGKPGQGRYIAASVTHQRSPTNLKATDCGKRNRVADRARDRDGSACAEGGR
jgi:hypothetical protein